MQDYYVILGVSSNASAEEIKSAYRRRAMELHPDRSGMGSEPLHQIQEAYSVLSDPAESGATIGSVTSLTQFELYGFGASAKNGHALGSEMP